jgi:nitrous oxide reductase accessory protein NosL
MIDATRPADVQYDRCSPSLLAFAQRIEAVQFVREHGGQVLPFKESGNRFLQVVVTSGQHQ